MSQSPDRPFRVLIVDDEPEIRKLLAYLMKMEGFETLQASNGKAALQHLRDGGPDVVLLDINMPDMDGMTVLKEARALDPNTPIILVTGFGSITNAVESVKNGAYDYVTKPFQNDELVLKIRRALENRCLKQENQALRQQVARDVPLRQLMGSSEQIQKVFANVDRVAPTDFTVIISGETGAGKELVARAIHRLSKRADQPFVPVDCGSIQPNLIESELFGHERGSFTGADRARTGKFEQASGGTLFLDEVQNLPLPVQTRFLRALQEKQICHVGGSKQLDIDIRVVAASNLNLERLAIREQFRFDLYHRLNEYSITIPPLRERRDDILYLAKRFLDLTSAELNKPVPGMSAAAVEVLFAHHWPGNVRELRNVIRRAVLLADGVLLPEHLGVDSIKTKDAASRSGAAPIGSNQIESTTNTEGSPGESISFKELVRRSVMHAEREILTRVLRQTNGNKAKAARLLQIDYKTIRTKAKQYGIPLHSHDDSHDPA